MTPPRRVAQLPPILIERIAAGEAIERPAAAVKELIENALDAGAREISIDIGGGGLDIIRVADDGHGMDAGDAERACQRHTSSKISTVDDLDSIRSLGFRGEALASLVAVAQVTIVTAWDEGPAAWQVVYRDGVLVHAGPAARRVGTTVTVRNLFAGLPGRRKFLGSGASEATRVVQVTRRYALAHPAVRFSLVSDARLTFRTTGSGRVDVVMGETWGTAIRAGLLELPTKLEGSATVSGWMGDRSTTRPTRSGIIIVVNGRPVQSSGLQEAMESAYRPLLPRGRHPYATMQIHCDASDVDANIHPAKTEVLLRRERDIGGMVMAVVRTALGTMPDRPPEGGWQRQSGQLSLVPVPSSEPSQPPRIREPSGDYETPIDRMERGRKLVRELPRMQLLGQVRRALILVEGRDGLYMVDQHRAHERVLFEQLAAGTDVVAAQSLLEPVALELKRHEAVLFQSRLAALRELGFSIERVGDVTFLVHAIPSVAGGAASLTPDDELSREMSWPGDNWHDRLRTAVACRSALRRGEVLQPAAMRQLLLDLAATDSPAVCPHGSPLVLEVTGRFLERQFDWS